MADSQTGETSAEVNGGQDGDSGDVKPQCEDAATTKASVVKVKTKKKPCIFCLDCISPYIGEKVSEECVALKCEKCGHADYLTPESTGMPMSALEMFVGDVIMNRFKDILKEQERLKSLDVNDPDFQNDEYKAVYYAYARLLQMMKDTISSMHEVLDEFREKHNDEMIKRIAKETEEIEIIRQKTCNTSLELTVTVSGSKETNDLIINPDSYTVPCAVRIECFSRGKQGVRKADKLVLETVLPQDVMEGMTLFKSRLRTYRIRAMRSYMKENKLGGFEEKNDDVTDDVKDENDTKKKRKRKKHKKYRKYKDNGPFEVENRNGEFEKENSEQKDNGEGGNEKIEKENNDGKDENANEKRKENQAELSYTETQTDDIVITEQNLSALVDVETGEKESEGHTQENIEDNAENKGSENAGNIDDKNAENIGSENVEQGQKEDNNEGFEHENIEDENTRLEQKDNENGGSDINDISGESEVGKGHNGRGSDVEIEPEICDEKKEKEENRTVDCDTKGLKVQGKELETDTLISVDKKEINTEQPNNNQFNDKVDSKIEENESEENENLENRETRTETLEHTADEKDLRKENSVNLAGENEHEGDNKAKEDDENNENESKEDGHKKSESKGDENNENESKDDKNNESESKDDENNGSENKDEKPEVKIADVEEFESITESAVDKATQTFYRSDDVIKAEEEEAERKEREECHREEMIFVSKKVLDDYDTTDGIADYTVAKVNDMFTEIVQTVMKYRETALEKRRKKAVTYLEDSIKEMTRRVSIVKAEVVNELQDAYRDKMIRSIREKQKCLDTKEKLRQFQELVNHYEKTNQGDKMDELLGEITNMVDEFNSDQEQTENLENLEI